MISHCSLFEKKVWSDGREDRTLTGEVSQAFCTLNSVLGAEAGGRVVM